MANLTFSRTTQQMTGSSFAGLFGLFAGLCAIFAGCVTLSDWYSETAQARWPAVSAVVERADVVATSRAPKDGGGTVWKLS
jgi:predicted alpha/beta superfamily hydrolase